MKNGCFLVFVEKFCGEFVWVLVVFDWVGLEVGGGYCGWCVVVVIGGCYVGGG